MNIIKMKKGKTLTLLLTALFVALSISCKDDSLDRLELDGINTAAILRTISTDLPVVDRNAPSETTLSVEVEFDDFLNQDTMESIDVFASFVDTTPVDETPDGVDNPTVKTFDEVFMTNVPVSNFSAGENGKLKGTISVAIGEVMSKINLELNDLYGGDIFLIRLELKTTNGGVYTSSNVGTKIQGSSAFLSPFRYSTSVVCPPPSGIWTIEMFDSYGDGWNGAAIVVNLNGVDTEYPLADGSSGSASINVPVGSSSLVFSFKSGAWDSEVTFNIIAPDGVITSGGPSPASGPIKLNVDFCL